MILTMLISFIVAILQGIFLLLPTVIIAEIPLIGEILSNSLMAMIRIWNSAIESFPYFGIVWQVFLVVIIPFELAMLVARFFLGSRLPSNDK